VASGLFFKVWHLDEKLRLASKVGAGVGALLVLWLIIKSFNTTLIASPITVGQLLILLVIITAGVAWPMLKWLWPEEATRSMIYKAALGVVGFPVSQLHLLIFNKRFLERGKLQRLLTLQR